MEVPLTSFTVSVKRGRGGRDGGEASGLLLPLVSELRWGISVAWGSFLVNDRLDIFRCGTMKSD